MRKRLGIIGAVLVLLAAIGVPVVLLHHSAAPTAPTAPRRFTTTAPNAPSAEICGNTNILNSPWDYTGASGSYSSGTAGLPSFDSSGTNFPGDTTAIVVAAGNNQALTPTYQHSSDELFFFATGVHTLGAGQYAQFQADAGDTFIGATGAIIDGQGTNAIAIAGPVTGITIEYLTIENFNAISGAAEAVTNQNYEANWTIEFDTIRSNAYDAGAGMGPSAIVEHNCLTDNGDYGFNCNQCNGALLEYNEISYNDSGGEYDQPGGGSPQNCGCAGGGKLWDTTGGATVTYNYVHDNGEVGLWVDTDNAGINLSDNYVSHNESVGIQYELSYDGQIENNSLVDNAWTFGSSAGLDGFPDSAIYISESGSNSNVSGNYDTAFNITGNVFINNWGGVVIWENSNRWCGNTDAPYCTLINPSVYTPKTCADNISETSPIDYFDNCRWRAQNINVSDNLFKFNPTDIPKCVAGLSAPNPCGYNALFSDYGNVPYTGATVPNNISNHQNNHFSDNTYVGPWDFTAFNIGESVTPAEWQAGFRNANGSGDPFGAQDAGSTFSP